MSCYISQVNMYYQHTLLSRFMCFSIIEKFYRLYLIRIDFSGLPNTNKQICMTKQNK